MVLIDGQYRNLSIISPLIYNGDNNLWTMGALFRTFPMMDHEISLPFAIDAPYELNSARKGIEEGYPEDILMIDYTNAYDALGEISGHSLKEDVIDEIFKRFCLGK